MRAESPQHRIRQQNLIPRISQFEHVKNLGYYIGHNFGHDNEFLYRTLFTLNIIAFLIHTILHFNDCKYQLIRDKLPIRNTFSHNIHALTLYTYFDNCDNCWNLLCCELSALICYLYYYPGLRRRVAPPYPGLVCNRTSSFQSVINLIFSYYSDYIINDKYGLLELTTCLDCKVT